MEEDLEHDYKNISLIGEGGFGEVYRGRPITLSLAETRYTNQEAAIKIEFDSKHSCSLYYEYKVYTLIVPKTVGFPTAYQFKIRKSGNAMVMELLGPSLSHLFKKCGGKFSLKTVLMVAQQVLQRLETLHSRQFIHRDIKPDNLLMGVRAKQHIVHLIDIGGGKRYIDSFTHEHIKYSTGHYFKGTIRYASMNSHKGIQLSRRDDLISIGYMLVCFLRGSLPWQGLGGENKHESIIRVGRKKEATSIEELSQGLPEEFQKYLSYVTKLKFEEAPDYNYLRNLFKDLFSKRKYEWDGQYDWVSRSERGGMEDCESKTPEESISQEGKIWNQDQANGGHNDGEPSIEDNPRTNGQKSPEQQLGKKMMKI